MEPDDWQIIETAPFERKSFLVWCPENQNIYLVVWSYSGGAYKLHHFGRGGLLGDTATHWRRLPEPPRAVLSKATPDTTGGE